MPLPILPDDYTYVCDVCGAICEHHLMHDKNTCESCFADCGGYEDDDFIGDQQLDSDPYDYDPPGW